MASQYIHMIVNLLAILAVMFGIILVSKKFKLSKYAGNKYIKIINMVPVGAKEKIILVEVNQAYLLLGATPNHIETLHVFNELISTPTLVNEQASKKSAFSEHLAMVNEKNF